jgi:signal transduction histidine kinase
MTPIRAEAIRTLYVQMRNSALSNVVVTLYMIGTAAPYTAWWFIAGWAAVMVLTQASRELLIRAWRRRARADAELDRWARAYTLYMVVTGLLWGSTIYLFAHPDQPITVALTMCCLYSIGAGSVPANAYNPPGLYAIVGFMFAPIVVRLLSTGRLEYILLGVASGLYAVAMSGMCRVQSRTLEEGFRIRFENTALLEALKVQTAEAHSARHKAELASLAKSQFLAAASHDLRQPLYALSLFSASLSEFKLGPEGQAVVGNIQDSIGTMEQLFEGLLDLSKLEAGVVQPRLGPVSVDLLFDRLSQYFRPIATDRGLDMRFRSDGEWVTADAALLEQVLGNLLSNALRYTVRGGVLVAARLRASSVRLEVWDTGAGIAAEDLRRIFDEFVQVGNAERDRRMGLGLGLSIARRSGALIGAKIDVASRLGRGSRFGFDLPAATPSLPAVPRDDNKAHLHAIDLRLRRASGLKLLIVDDDTSVRSALGELLTRWNVPFDAAADADSALALLNSGECYGLVLADYRLPGRLNGLDLIAAIAARQSFPAPTAALITADFSPDLVSAARDAGVPVFLKPLQPTKLRAILGLAAPSVAASAGLPVRLDGGSGARS